MAKPDAPINNLVVFTLSMWEFESTITDFDAVSVPAVALNLEVWSEITLPVRVSLPTIIWLTFKSM